MKISESKLSLALASSTVSKVFAFIHTGFWCIGVIAFLDMMFSDGMDNLSGFLMSVVFVGLGVLWIRNSNKKKKFVNLCREYFASLEGYSRISVNEFAEIVNGDTQIVRQNMTTMIRRGYIEGVTLNVRDDYISVHTHSQPKFQPQQQPQSQQRVQQQQIAKKVVSVPVTCESCMGITMLPVNSEGVCEYCGSKIKS